MFKILNIISDTNIGGAGKVLLTFLRNFDRELYEMAVVLPKGSKLTSEIERLGVRVIPSDGISDKSFDIVAIKRMYRLFKQEKPDIVHTHACLSARIAARLYGKCKIVHTRHSIFDEPAYKRAFPYKQVFGFINNRCSDIIIAVSPVVKIDLVEKGTSQRKIVVVYNGVDALSPLTKSERRSVRLRYNLSEMDFVCGIVARLESVKGHEYVLKAAQLLSLEDKDIKFLIVGTGTQEFELRNTAEKNGVTNCIFTGFVEDIREIMGILDLQINASYGTEATSISLLEGMSLGIPAVVSDFGGNPYVINDGINGLLFESRDYAEMCKAIQAVKASEKDYQHYSSRALEIYNEKFTSKAMTAGVENVYRSLLVPDDKQPVK